ncbi:MAG TPA: AsmA family protein, partial [Burkholderiaceae bacterium]|nr:AsmA family protein [Burkholderiaceae bacterium]
MKVWFKRIVLALLLVVLVALAGAALFVLTFNPNQYKYKLEEFVYDRYQRTLAIEGEIELSVFPRIGLSLSQVSLSERNSKQPFASLETARLAVAIWPLLFNKLVVDHVAIDG